ncbi:hypothetical protein WKT22_02816 [Candidatus Lokiarchaeum ossiferum]
MVAMDIPKVDLLFQSMLSTLGENLLFVGLMDPDKQIVTQIEQENLSEMTKAEISNFFYSRMFDYFFDNIRQEHSTFSFNTLSINVIVSVAGDDYIAIFISSVKENTAQFLPYVYLCTEKIARIGLGRNISYVIPKIKFQSDDNGLISGPHRFEMKEEGDYVIKAVLGGDSGVGKTTLVEHFIHDKFEGDYKSTLGINIMSKGVKYPRWKCNIEYSIYDLGGQSIYKQIRKGYYFGANVGFLVFDVTNKESFEHIQDWYDEIITVEPDTLLILVGNKIDLEGQRQISSGEAESLAKKLNVQYLETCALNKDIVDEAFKTLGFAFILKNNTLERKRVDVKSGWVF